MSGPVLLWEHVAAGFVEPLDDFAAPARTARTRTTSSPALLAANRWTGRFGDPLGAGPLLEIPVNCESYNLAYVPEILERTGSSVPTTWEGDFFERRGADRRRRGRCAASASAARTLAHDVHRLRHPVLVVRRPRLR